MRLDILVEDSAKLMRFPMPNIDRDNLIEMANAPPEVDRILKSLKNGHHIHT